MPGDPRVFMRVNGHDDQPLEWTRLDGKAEGVLAIKVPGFGMLLMHPDRDEALLATDRRTGPVARAVTRFTGRSECPMLHKADRLDVVVVW
jgi:hypothetical protein